MFYFKLALAGLAIVALSGCESGFQEEDIENVKQGIRSEYELRGITVNNVQLAKESSKTLKGFANLSHRGVDVTYTCEATYGKDNNIVYACKP